MARKDRNRRRDRRRRTLEDLDPYLGCRADENVGLDPLAVGWLQRNQPFPTGPVPEGFPEALLAFCFEEHTVCATRATHPCPLCGERVEPMTREGFTARPGTAEIRVLGEDDIFAAPDLIHHYVTVHDYRPPQVFIEAVLNGPSPGSPEHRALVRTLNM